MGKWPIITVRPLKSYHQWVTLVPNFYHRKEWKKYRELCLDAAGYACERFSNKGVLQIHHPEYKKGLKPWEYPVEFCEVLCRNCHSEIHGFIPPSGGWEIICSDLETNEPSDTIPCGYCTKDIRWHVTVYHLEWGELIVGTECAENLSLGPEIKELKSYHRRMRTFVVSPRWVKTKKGNKISYQDHSVLIYQKGEGYWLKIDSDWGREEFPDHEKAKERAFMVIENRIKYKKRKVEPIVSADPATVRIR
jgi:hypothetical protein